MTDPLAADALVIGGGLSGTLVATILAGKGLYTIILDSGISRSDGPGRHLSRDPRLRFGTEAHGQWVGAALSALPQGPDNLGHGQIRVGLTRGGASVLWTGILHHLDTPTEEARSFARTSLEPWYDQAGVLLRAGGGGGPSVGGFQPLAMAGMAGAALDGGTVTDPLSLLSDQGSPRISCLWSHVATRLRCRSSRVLGVEAIDLSTGQKVSLSAEHVILANDPLRGPALLQASGIGREAGFPVGAYLADHPLAIARVAVQTDRARELHAALWRPGRIPRAARLSDAPEGIHALALVPPGPAEAPTLHLYWYLTGHPWEDNTVDASGADPEGLGLFQARVSLRRPVAEATAEEALLAHLKETVETLGPPLPGWRPRLYPLGTAAHPFGTLRAGAPGSGVTDPEGRVHGFDNLWVLGTARFPGPNAANPMFAVASAALGSATALADPSSRPLTAPGSGPASYP
ncbi:GMC oxidoreductase [Rhodospirillum sp. A1_3_36]|uniref:GMC oxidoreductase n=1 Tax=Rhodospirillum sp. A1_3_36 TaxID=3391666 RepID=UPI0039A708D4